MADGSPHDLIIVRRHEEEEHEHHSSAWKVAHADFMTAMMAFFLIMWLINVTDDQIRKGISQYFNPIHLSQGSTEMKGLNEPDPGGEKSGKKGHADSASVFNPVTLSQGHAETKEIEPSEAAAAAAAAAAGEAEAKTAKGEGAKAGLAEAGEDGKAAAGDEHPGAASGTSAVALDAQGVGDRERAAFQDPYAVLAQLAQKYSVDHATSADVVIGDDRNPGFAGGEVNRDPFDPVYWQLADVPPARTDQPGEPGLARAVPEDALPDATAPAHENAGAKPLPRSALDSAKLQEKPGEPPASSAPTKESATPTVETPPAPKQAEVAASEPPARSFTKAPDAVTAAAAASIKDALAQTVKETMAGAATPNLSVTATADGILIDLTDDADFSMFEVGSAIPNPTVVVLMERIAKVLSEKQGEIVVRGHSDGRPFRSDVYDNWRLSAARAHMAYYMLTRGGLSEKRVARIEGYADRALKAPTDPYAAENRRIEILLVGAQ